MCNCRTSIFLLSVLSACVIYIQMNAVATLSAVVMPALLPSCAVLLEMGTKVLHGYKRPKVMAVSPDGIIR